MAEIRAGSQVGATLTNAAKKEAQEPPEPVLRVEVSIGSAMHGITELLRRRREQLGPLDQDQDRVQAWIERLREAVGLCRRYRD